MCFDSDIGEEQGSHITPVSAHGGVGFSSPNFSWFGVQCQDLLRGVSEAGGNLGAPRKGCDCTWPPWSQLPHPKDVASWPRKEGPAQLYLLVDA